MATYDLTQTTPSKLQTGDIINVPYSGAYKTITLPKGVYKLEVWGAQGGSFNTTYVGGKGGYSYGTLTLKDKETVLYCYAGGKGTDGTTNGTFAGGFNGGGTAYTSSATYDMSAGGGGSDIRIGTDSLYARVIVAGGGGGAGSYSGSNTFRYSGGAGGGESGAAGGQYSTSYKAGLGGTQTAAGTSYYGTTTNSTSYGTPASFGQGASGKSSYIAAGGGGWYGGGYARRAAGGGGSGYVYTSSTASNYPSGCLLTSAYYLTDAATVAGNTAFIDPDSGSSVTGRSGNGYVRITVIQTNNSLKVKHNGTWQDAQGCYVKTENNTWAQCKEVYVKTTENITLLDYIESTGTQRIDTGIGYNSNNEYVIETECEWLGASGTYSGWDGGGQFGNYQGYWGTSSSSAFTEILVNSGFAQIHLTIQAGSSSNTILQVTQNGVVNTTTRAHASIANYATLNYPIFAYTNNSGGYAHCSSSRIKSFKMRVNGVLVRDYIPVLDASGVACLYDKATNQLFYNQGTGEFIAGYKSTFEPETELPFLKSDGNQYIDTGFIPNQSTRLVIDFEMDAIPSSTTSLFGARVSSSSNQFDIKVLNTGVFRTDFNTSKIEISGVNVIGRHYIDKNKNITIIDNVTVTNTDSTFTPNHNLILFAQNNNGTVNEMAIMKMYSCQIYDNDILIRDYIPKTDSQGIPALYDKVSNTYYCNAGTGTFKAGEILKRFYWKQVI